MDEPPSKGMKMVSQRAKDRSQRWRNRRSRFIDNDTTIDPKRYGVDVIHCYRQAKPFVIEHHYSGTFPATRLSCGLFRNGPAGTSQLVGVCAFSVPVNNASVSLHTGLNDPTNGVDLGRLVLLDDVEANGESWFVSRAFSLLRQVKPGIQSVIAYSDPMPRYGQDGTILMPGHCGLVYQALSARFRGCSKARVLTLLPTGHVLSPRAVSKIRAQETGAAYAERQLMDAGAPPRGLGERPDDWLYRLDRLGFFARVKHPGNLVYTFALTKAARLAGRSLPSSPFPRLTTGDRRNLTVHALDTSQGPL